MMFLIIVEESSDSSCKFHLIPTYPGIFFQICQDSHLSYGESSNIENIIIQLAALFKIRILLNEDSWCCWRVTIRISGVR